MMEQYKNLNALYEEPYDAEKGSGCHYYTNALGEINIPGAPALYGGCVDELPLPAQTLYETYQTEGVAAPVYVMNVRGEYGMGIGFLLPLSHVLMEGPDNISDDWKYHLLEMAAEDLATWLAGFETQDVTVFLGRNTDPEGSEVLVFIRDNRCEELLGEECRLANANMEKVWAKADEFLEIRWKQSRELTIAIDGPVAAGKTTQAKALAQNMGLTYCDTGAMYRGLAVGLDANRKDADESLEDTVKRVLPSLKVEVMSCKGRQVTLLNGEDVTSQLRTEKISMLASSASAIPEVRAHLLKLQRRIARRGGVVMEGRDIGTVVMPKAKVKVFLTASPEIRARRRCAEYASKGEDGDVPYDQVLKNIRERDAQDMGRKNAPLKQAEDAILLTNSNLGIEATTEAIYDIIVRKMTAVDKGLASRQEKIEDNCENRTHNCDSCCKNGDCVEQGMDGQPRWMEGDDSGEAL